MNGDGPPTEVDTVAGVAPPPRASRRLDAIAAGGEFGRFTILQMIGAGGMGVVMAAYDPQLDRKVAIKVLRSHGKAQRLLREARAMAKLSHPNVVTVYDAGTIEGRVYIAMEFVAGQTLRAWRAEKPRAIDEILDVAVKAGRGLAAGHAVGLVHRDFKPDNVLVGGDGRVRVIDFGLARPIDLREDTATDVSRPSQPLIDDDTIGDLSGTPRYMAPEQHGFADLDARADQFAFCVTVYEALYGRVPFEVQTYPELVAAVTAGKVTIPAQPVVPKRVTDALVRGLRANPAERFGSIDALLAELEPPKPKRTRTVAIVGGTAALAAAALTFAAVRFGTGAKAADTCDGGDERITAAWSGDTRTRVRAALVASKRSHAAATADRVDHDLDRYANEWRARRREVCEATRVRHERSEVAFDLGMRCLDERAEEVQTLTGLLGAGPDVALADRAVEAVERLPPIEPCAAVDPGALAAPPAVEELQRAAAEIRAYYAAGKFALAVDKTQQLLPRAKALGWVPFEAEVELQLGQAMQQSGHIAEAEAAVRESIQLAARAKDDLLLARAWTLLVGVVGFQAARYEEGLALVPVADAAIVRAGGGDILAGDLAYSVAATHLQHGIYDKARDYFQKALDLRIKAYGEDHPDVAQVHNGLGATLLRRGELGAAADHFKTSIALREKILGPTHPDVALPLANLAAVEQAQGHVDDAMRDLQHALQILEEIHGPDHPQVALTVHNLGEFAREAKHCGQAVGYYERALAAFEKLGPTHPYVALPAVGLAQCLVDLGKPKDAIGYGERAVDIFTKQSGDPAQLAEAKFALARALWAGGGDRTRALALAGEARKALVAAGPVAGPPLAALDAWLATTRTQ